MTREVLVVGGGISGLSAAFELSENHDVRVTLIEAEDTCGGKMRGWFNEAEGRFEEHSIRALGDTYLSLFDIFHRADMLDVLSPVDAYVFYERESGRNIAVERKGPISASKLVAMTRTFGLAPRDIAHLARAVLHHVNASPEEREAMAHRTASDAIGVDGFEPSTRRFIVNWFGILTGARMHSKAVDIMDSFLLMFMPMTASPHLPPGARSKSYCFNRPTSEAVDRLVAALRERGVRIETGIPMHAIRRQGERQDGETIRVETGRVAIDAVAFEAAVMAVPHEV